MRSKDLCLSLRKLPSHHCNVNIHQEQPTLMSIQVVQGMAFPLVVASRLEKLPPYLSHRLAHLSYQVLLPSALHRYQFGALCSSLGHPQTTVSSI